MVALGFDCGRAFDWDRWTLDALARAKKTTAALASISPAAAHCCSRTASSASVRRAARTTAPCRAAPSPGTARAVGKQYGC